MDSGSEFSVTLSRTAPKELAKVPVAYRARIVTVLTSLKTAPYSGKLLKGELAGRYSLRVWPYRIIYRITATELLVEVLDIGHRQGIYK